MLHRRPTQRFLLRALGGLGLIALLLLGGMPGRVALGAAPARQGIGELYLALGDSLGVGLLSSRPATHGYVALFHDRTEQQAGHDVTLRNLSVSGETATSLIAGGQLQAAQEAIAEAQGNGWRVSPITIDIGGNDLSAVRGADEQAREAGLAAFRANIAQIFDTLVAATTQNGVRTGDIITMTVYNPYGGDPQIAHSGAWWVARFNTAITEAAAQRGIAVADVYTRFLGHERELTWEPLDVHANTRGHRAMAEELWKAAGYDVTESPRAIVVPTAGQRAHAVPMIPARVSDALHQ
jgi:lysophospholipase L1-like esterase